MEMWEFSRGGRRWVYAFKELERVGRVRCRSVMGGKEKNRNGEVPPSFIFFSFDFLELVKSMNYVILIQINEVIQINGFIHINGFLQTDGFIRFVKKLRSFYYILQSFTHLKEL